MYERTGKLGRKAKKEREDKIKTEKRTEARRLEEKR